jgi:hypothetical protein
MPVLAKQSVATILAKDLIVTIMTLDLIVTPAATQNIIAAVTVNVIVASAARKALTSVRPGDDQRFAASAAWALCHGRPPCCGDSCAAGAIYIFLIVFAPYVV